LLFIEFIIASIRYIIEVVETPFIYELLILVINIIELSTIRYVNIKYGNDKKIQDNVSIGFNFAIVSTANIIINGVKYNL
jgi:hypothetical protein